VIMLPIYWVKLTVAMPFHRYETSNLRHRYKVEKRLEELQSRRKEQARASGVSKPGEECFAKHSQDVL